MKLPSRAAFLYVAGDLFLIVTGCALSGGALFLVMVLAGGVIE